MLERLSDFDDVPCNSTDVNSNFYFRTIAEANIKKKPTEFEGIQGNWVRRNTGQITEIIMQYYCPILNLHFNLSICTGMFVDDDIYLQI